MWSHCIVITSPAFDLVPRIRQRCELMDVEALVAQPPVEALDVPVVGRFPRPREVERHAARYRWAELLRRIVEVDPLACPRCRSPMRIVAVLTDPAVIARILAHRARTRERTRSPPPLRRRVAPPTATS